MEKGRKKERKKKKMLNADNLGTYIYYLIMCPESGA